eukprot:scaffold3915_cov60-Phaeocystis_antarctica.AAC.1
MQPASASGEASRTRSATGARYPTLMCEAGGGEGRLPDCLSCLDTARCVWCSASRATWYRP